jgi:methylated-DNA-[protein]-cysteine S-methyltransferase
MSIHIHTYKSPVGELLLGEYNDQLVLADWKYRQKRIQVDERLFKRLNTTYAEHPPVHEAAIAQLDAYFTGKRTVFSVPLLMIGTEFQKEVCTELLKIKFGQTSSYLDLSKRMNKEKAVRAVAAANGANPISIFVPCPSNRWQ